MAQDTIDVPPLPNGGSSDASSSTQLARDFMTDLTGAGKPPETPPAATPPADKTPAAKPADATPPAAAVKPAVAAPAAAKPAEAAPAKPAAAAPARPKAPVNVDDPKLGAVELRAYLKEIQADREKTVTEKQREIDTLQGKIREFEGKRFWTEEDQKLSEKAATRLAQLEADVYGRDYRASPEFKTQFQDKFDRLWKKGAEVVKGLSITWTEGEEEKTRPATDRDLIRVVDAPPAERYKLAKQLFGDDFTIVMDYANKLNDIRESADEAVAEKQRNYETDSQKQAQQLQATGQQIETFVKTASDNLFQQFPDIFTAKDDQPELAAALKKGFDFVDESRMNQGKMNVNERAARIAILRSWAGAFPRLVTEIAGLRTKLAAMETENATYRKSDPGTLGEGGGGTSAAATEGAGSDDLAKEIERLGKA